MEKFGIFELLDTLSAIAEGSSQDEGQESNTPPPKPSPNDKSFLPPDLSGAANADGQSMPRDALTSLYERHERISKRIDKKQ